MKEKFERFKNEKIVINVRSQKQYDDFMKMCEEQGLKWYSGHLPTKQNIYNDCEEETCIDLNNLNTLDYCDIDYFKNDGYKIITYKYFMKKSNQFTKSDLKDNHIVVLRDKTKHIWKDFDFKKEFNNDLTHNEVGEVDIIEVYEFETLVWKREESILDDKEKEWLNHFIKSTEIKVNYIVKYEMIFYSKKECLKIDYNINGNRESITFPSFKKGSMYKGMEVDKEYTLKELGLE